MLTKGERERGKEIERTLRLWRSFMSKMDSSASSSANMECSPESRQGMVAELGPFFLVESILFPVKVLGKVRCLILCQSLGIAQNVGVKAVLGDLGGISLQLLELFKAWL